MLLKDQVFKRLNIGLRESSCSDSTCRFSDWGVSPRYALC